MARFAELLISGDYATGLTYYEDYHPTQENLARIVLNVTVGGSLTIEAVMDTGAPWCILDPAIVRRLGLAEIASYKPETKLIIRGIPYEGRLLRTGISLRDEYGENDLEVDATVFVPTLTQDGVWNHPNFIGLDGFLNRIRFAVDPVENVFYFGPLE
jgi:hypothetical protein